MTNATQGSTSTALSTRQQFIPVIGAFAAAGDLSALNQALNSGLDAGLAVNEIKEILVQVYAYAGFPRSLNALGEFMKVVQARQDRGIDDDLGKLPSKAAPVGDQLLAAGTSNQTKLIGAPASSPVFEFAPAIDNYLKTHLFGDIFERDNLDWHSRELATLGMLSSLPGANSQLQSHFKISSNIGLTDEQLAAVADVLHAKVNQEAGARAEQAFAAFKANRPKG